MPKVILPIQKRQYWEHRDAGYSMRASAQRAGFSLSTAQTLERGNARERHPRTLDSGAQEQYTAEPKRYDQLSAEAKRAWDDFPYFQRRYFGRVPMAWQEDAAWHVVQWLESEEEEYTVTNAPPGVGKTLLFTHDIPAWITVRNRAIRGMLGAMTQVQAEKYTNRLKRTFERTLPQKGKAAEVAAKMAYDAEATLVGDFGRFKPLEKELWTKGAFVVAQYADQGAIVEKEPTWSAYGFDTEFLGGRMDFINWDDLVDPRKQRSIMSIEQLRDEWDDLAETRLEPRGLLMLTGQRLSSNDLYRYNLDKRVPLVIDEETDEVIESVPKYHHLIYQAHDASKCDATATHRRGAPEWPTGCLLSPTRLPWRKISGLKHQRPERYEVVYQQQDVDPATVLVQKAWIHGDGDFPGCLDNDRDRLEIPRNRFGQSMLTPPLFSAISVDPSPTHNWGVQWWVYQPATKYRFLMDQYRGRLQAPEFLEWNPDANQYSGMLNEWFETARGLHLPISHLIVEINAAQRFMVQYKFFTDWLRLKGVQLVQHTTHRNKTDPEYGVWTVQEQWRLGRIRLPFKANSEGRFLSMRFMEEVTMYPDANTTDLLMAHWFFEFQLPKLYHEDTEPTVMWRPSWSRERASRYYGG